MQKGIRIKIYIDKKSLSNELISRWFTDFVYFKPTKMKLENRDKNLSGRFNKAKFHKEILNLYHCKKGFNFYLSEKNMKDNVNMTMGVYSREVVSLSLSIKEETYIKKKDEILLKLEDFIKTYGCISGFVNSSYNNFMQNITDIKWYESYGGDISKLYLIEDPIFKGDNQIIDIEHNSGHSHLCEGIWFGVAWLMWFGKGFYSYISKGKIKEYSDLFSTVEYENGVLEIKLYENIEDYPLEKNQKKQQNFRDKLRIDEIAHKIPEKKTYDDLDPEMEIVNDGKSRYMISYLDDNDILTSKSKATKKKRSEIL